MTAAHEIKGGIDHLLAAFACVSDWRVAVDGGAHEGDLTALMRERFETVHAFEPGPLPLPILWQRSLGWPNVTVHGQALGDREGRVWFGHDGKKTRSRSWFADRAREGETAMVRLDDLQLPSLGLLKLDLEGGELAALRGGEQTIRRHRPVLVIETAKVTFKRTRDSDGAALFGFVAALGYRIARRLPRDTVFVPIS